MPRFENALAGSRLRELVREMEAEGRTQVDIYECFERFRALLSRTEREAEEDTVMDTMDCIVGCCHPKTRLFTHYVTNEEIAAYRQLRNAASENGA